MASGLPRRMLPANLEADFLYKKISNYNKSEEEKQNIIGMINLINAINFDSSNPAEKLKSKNDIINFTKQHALDPPYIYVQNSYPFGVTPLWLAVKNNYTEFIEPLLNAGANANITVDSKKLYDIASPEAKAILDTYKKRGGRYRRKSLKKRKSKSKKSKTKKRN
jgi:ankyrin repeat protein